MEQDASLTPTVRAYKHMHTSPTRRYAAVSRALPWHCGAAVVAAYAGQVHHNQSIYFFIIYIREVPAYCYSQQKIFLVF
jgi:hypothetical protein